MIDDESGKLREFDVNLYGSLLMTNKAGQMYYEQCRKASNYALRQEVK